MTALRPYLGRLPTLGQRVYVDPAATVIDPVKNFIPFAAIGEFEEVVAEEPRNRVFEGSRVRNAALSKFAVTLVTPMTTRKPVASFS